MPSPLYVAFVWHMHQPYYRDTVTGGCSMPWVRLHAAKDYLDMVARLEAFPSIHQTFNLVPSLMEQLQEYLPPQNRSDTFLDLSRKPADQLTPEDRRFVLEWFFLAHWDRMIKPLPRYHDLLAKRGARVMPQDWPAVEKRFTTQDYLDLQVWFNLAWIDPWLRRQDPALRRLEEQGSRFTEEDKRAVLDAQLAILAKVIPAYQAAAKRGQVELTTTPYYHPIMPLLCDTNAALAALPQLPLPSSGFRKPEDARWHLQHALRSHEALFGMPARGVWPSEGSVSDAVAELACDAGLGWIATDEAILWRSLQTGRNPADLYRPHRLERNGKQTAIIFRDRELSDLIGFTYSQWDPAAAAADFLRRLDGIRAQTQRLNAPALVSIILDGENAWEFYPNDGHEFFQQLYAGLAADARFRCVTVSEFLQQHPPTAAEAIPRLFSGSWIDGNFATWIGHREKNAAWDLLAQARESLAGIDRADPEKGKAWQALGIAEGSDWMWWFGDTHYSAQADEFDRLFRTHLANAYELAGLPVPEAVRKPIRQPAREPVLSPTGPVRAVLDGRQTTYYEWLYAGSVNLKQSYGAIQRGGQCLRSLYYGHDGQTWALRLDVDPEAWAALTDWAITLAVGGKTVTLTASGASGDVPAKAAAGALVEIEVPLAALGLAPGQALNLSVALAEGGEQLERYPVDGAFELPMPPADAEAHAW